METNKKHTPTPWRVRYFPDGKDCFVEADKKKPEHRYDIEIMGDDTGGDYYPYEQKEADCHFIVTACNSYHSLKQQNEELIEQTTKLQADKDKMAELLKDITSGMDYYLISMKDIPDEKLDGTALAIKLIYENRVKQITETLSECGYNI